MSGKKREILSSPDRSDQRTAGRYPLVLHAAASFPDGSRSDVTILDISETGSLIAIDRALQVGQEFELFLDTAPDDAILSQLAWCGDGIFGCQFASPLSKLALSSARLRGQPVESVVRRAPSSVDLSPSAISGARRASGYSATEMAQALGVSRPTLWAWETGKSRPSGANAKVVRDFMARVGFTPPSRAALVDDSGTADRGMLENIVPRYRQDLASEIGVPEQRIRISIEF
jgi:DNA-binding transcriptional regulator YiaG